MASNKPNKGSSNSSSNSSSASSAKRSPRGSTNADVVVLGGGLTGSLTALKLKSEKPDLNVVLIEQNDRLGGSRTWVFHGSDLPKGADGWVQQLVERTWDSGSVRFPRVTKSLPGPYHLIRSENLHEVVTKALGDNVHLGSTVVRATDSQVELENGDTVTASLVLDARGLAELPSAEFNGYQKSLGFEYQLEEPHALGSPVVIDATCPQIDGLRYFQVLPLDERRLLVEEKFYSDNADLNQERINRSVRSYTERNGWKIREVVRQETTVMPVPMTSDYIKSSAAGEPLPIGSRGGYFHATTGDTLMDAVLMAEQIVTLPDLKTDAVREALTKKRRPWLSKQRFYRIVNRFLFLASEPSLRYQVLQQIYEFSPELIRRFQSGRTSWTDRIRILRGRPNVPFERAVKSLSERSVQERLGTEK